MCARVHTCVRACVLASVPAYCVPAACHIITGGCCVRSGGGAAGDAHTFVRACVARSDGCAPADGAFVRSSLLQPPVAVAGRRHTTLSDDGPSQSCSGWVSAPPPRAGNARTCMRCAQQGLRCCGRWTAGGARRHRLRWRPAPPAGVAGPANGGSCGVGGWAAAGGGGQAVVAARAGDARGRTCVRSCGRAACTCTYCTYALWEIRF